VAVVQISRIQVRRGQANQGTGIPQLASGELGWAVDTQELYIGNGSVVEGAPAVGNSKILTEHDNFFELAETYNYKSGELGTVSRTLQNRLDDRVSVRAFGAKGDGSDATAQLQTALLDLYYNQQTKTNPQSRVALYVEPGVYRISETVYIPPYVTLIGAGRDKTVFEAAGGFDVFSTVSNNSTYTGTLQSFIPLPDPILVFADGALGITMSGFTIKVDSTTALTNMLVINSTRESRFRDIKFIGPRLTGPAEDCGIFIRSKSNAITSSFNKIIDCEFIGLGCAIKSEHNIKHNDIEECYFDRCVAGIEIGRNQEPGQNPATYNHIVNNYFEDIDEVAINFFQGTKNSSVRNKFGESVGNNGGDASTAAWPIVNFVETGNISVDDVFDRTYNLAINQNYIVTEPHVPEVQGPAFVDYGFSETVEVEGSGVPNVLFRLSAEATKKYEVDYFYKSTAGASPTFSRAGTITVLINRETNTVTLSDDYTTAGDSSLDENLEFTAALVQNEGQYSVQVKEQNPLDQGSLTYRVLSRS